MRARSKILILFFFTLLIAGCGKKAPPVAVETLNIPIPDWVEIALTDEGMVIKNPSDNTVLAERAVSEVGDLGFPFYYTVATLTPMAVFIDNATRQNERYLYRFTTYNRQFRAYSEPFIRAVSYRGPINVEQVKAEIRGSKLCLEYTLTRSAVRAEVIINGQTVLPDKDSCYAMPFVARIIYVIVPYSESGVTGQAYSQTIDLGSENILLPPQNLRIIRSEGSVTVSFDKVNKATGYRVQARGAVTNISSSESIFRFSVTSEECLRFMLFTLRGREVSPPVEAYSCP